MSEPFLAEIRIMACPFPPKDWAWCDGQLLSITQNTALFSVIGTTYGGNGTINFALPNLQGRAPMHPGQGPGLSDDHEIGEQGGDVTVTLTATQIPTHSHSMMAATTAANSKAPAGNVLARSGNGNAYLPPAATNPVVPMSNQALLPAGGLANGSAQPHNNMQPYLALYFNIALKGMFPPRG